MQETQVQSLGWEDPLEKGMSTHSTILAWRIPWTENLAGYNPWGHRVGHNRGTNATEYVLYDFCHKARLHSFQEISYTLKQAEAADTFLKSKTKHSFFQKDKDTVTVGLKAYQEAVGQVAAIKRLLDDPIYTPRERIEMQQATAAAERSKREYDTKSAELDAIIEERTQERIALLNRTEPTRIQKLEKELRTAKNDLDYVCNAIEQCLNDHGINIQEFERRYKVNLGTDSQDMNGFDDILPT